MERERAAVPQHRSFRWLYAWLAMVAVGVALCGAG